MSGGKGNDGLYGGTGADVFIYKGAVDEGRDTIYDFADGKDMIRIAGDSGDVASITSTGFRGANTKISLSSGTDIILQGVKAYLIGLDDFDFV